MPADFVKFEPKQEGIAERLRQCPHLDFRSRTTKKGNLIWEAWFKNMKFEIYEPSLKVEVSGSLHYLFNDGLYNWNDFARLDLFDTVTDFCSLFGIEPQKAVLHGLEIAVNIKVPYEPSYFIERVLAYKTGKIERLTDKADMKDAIKIEFNQYRLKIYNKSKHQRQFIKDAETNILRFEVKITRMARLSMIGGLNTLHDLLKPEVLQKLGRMLLNEFSELIVSEPMDTEGMTAKEQTTFEQMNNREFWALISSKGKRRDSKNRFKNLSEKYGTGLHETTLMLASEKWGELLQWKCVEENPNFAPFNRGGVLTESMDKYEVPVLIEKPNVAPFYHLYIKGITHARNNALKGANIKEQEESGGLFLNKKKCSKCANCRKVLADSLHKYCNERCKEMKNKRNVRSNPIHSPKYNLLKKVNDSVFKYHIVLPLFANDEVLKLTSKQKELLGQTLINQGNFLKT